MGALRPRTGPDRRGRPQASIRRTRRPRLVTSSSTRTRSAASSTSELRDKIEDATLEHVFESERLDELRARGREHAQSSADALEKARAQIGDDDLFTFIYTSGTTGPPKACMILNRNYYDMVGRIDEIESFFLPTDVMLLYLPLAHNFGRLMHLLGAHLGYTIAFVPDPRRLGEVMPQVRPTVLPTVPRVLEKVHTAVSANFAAATGVKRRLIDWALGVGSEVSELRQRQEPVPARARFQAPDRGPTRLLEGQGTARRTAAGRDLGRRSAGEGDRRVLPHARHPDPRGLRPDRGDDGVERQPPEPLQVRHRRAGDSRDRGQDGRGRRDPDQAGRPCSRGTTRTRRRPGGAARRRLAAHRRRRRDRRGRLPDRHRPQEGHHRHRGRQERRAAEHREPAQGHPLGLAGAGRRRPAPVPRRADHARPGRGREAGRTARTSHALVAETVERHQRSDLAHFEQIQRFEILAARLLARGRTRSHRRSSSSAASSRSTSPTELEGLYTD